MLKAGSLVETVISLAILSICVGIATLVFVNTTSAQSPYHLGIKIDTALDTVIGNDYTFKPETGVYEVQGVTISKDIWKLKRQDYIEIIYTAQLGSVSKTRKLIIQSPIE